MEPEGIDSRFHKKLPVGPIWAKWITPYSYNLDI
jgi:hypothetical protein